MRLVIAEFILEETEAATLAARRSGLLGVLPVTGRRPERTLGVPRHATRMQIRDAYREKAKRLHPDHGGDEESMKELNAAYRELMSRG